MILSLLHFCIEIVGILEGNYSEINRSQGIDSESNRSLESQTKSPVQDDVRRNNIFVRHTATDPTLIKITCTRSE